MSIVIGVDASNIRKGGGITHLQNLLKYVSISQHDIGEVVVFADSVTLSGLIDSPWISKQGHFLIEGGTLSRVIWRHFFLPRMLKLHKCDVLFAPGGIVAKTDLPTVTMSRNMLPFDAQAQRLYPRTKQIRYKVLNLQQKRSFQRCSGLIFLTEPHKEQVEKSIGRVNAKSMIIPHGVDSGFFSIPSRTAPLKLQSFRWLYISFVKPYKHQWNVIKAVSILRNEGFDVQLDIVGPAYLPSLKRMMCSIEKEDPKQEFIKYHGSKNTNQLYEFLGEADGFVFASTCETFGQVLLEAMASALPVACTNIPVALALTERAFVYFDAEDPAAIAQAMKEILVSPELRQRIANTAREIAKNYSPVENANTTFEFICDIAGESTT